MQFTPYIKQAPVQHNESALYEIEVTKKSIEEMLKNNTGKIVIKLGATWCGPCKRIESHVVQYYNEITEKFPNIKCIMIDVDESFEIYGMFKTMRQISGIPAILCFNKGNVSPIPNDSVIGADHAAINEFFKRVIS
jgi:thioredoxin-like negative regulator of GroEL